ncbi:hypothetical protein AVEN_166481-1 [Araneus ventricosus]|uniref:Histone-lysine N-methyltransferase SETMAR n=1 Tax=Araneus ventricosus TaxID=182803 RepID=A0A4Y2JK25_ARAVE|nr:hypothetical protein AVEN_166481-1 [Araneus ventricosus]
MADRIEAPSKCELRSVILFLQGEGWFVEDDQCSCFLLDFTTTAKSRSDFWSCPHSNSRPHSAVAIQQLLKQFKLGVSDHLAYSPDLATSDFYLLHQLKNRLGVQSFQRKEDIQSSFKAHLTSLAATFFDEGIGNLIHRYYKYLNHHGDNVER